MHDGRFASLEAVLDFYARVSPADREHLIGQRERTLDLVPHLTAAQRQDLIAFLQTLTSPLPPAQWLSSRSPGGILHNQGNDGSGPRIAR